MNAKTGEAHPARSSRSIKRVITMVVLIIVIFLVVAYLGVSTYAASALTKPPRTFDPSLNPGKYILEYEEFTFPAREDGLIIAAWYIPSDANEKVIILVHGIYNSRTNGFLDQFVYFASQLHKAGYSVMMFDLRAHGQSADARFTFGIKERRDILGAVDWLEGRGYQPGKIGVLGYSLGAGSVIGAAAEEADIGAIWVDSAYADIKSVIQHAWVGMTGLPQVFFPSTVAMVRLLYGYDILASRPIDEIGSLAPRAIFMAHCQKDELIGISHLERLSAAVPNAQTWIIPNCDSMTLDIRPAGLRAIMRNHAMGYNLNPDEYTAKVVQFFDENLK